MRKFEFQAISMTLLGAMIRAMRGFLFHIELELWPNSVLWKRKHEITGHNRNAGLGQVVGHLLRNGQQGRSIVSFTPSFWQLLTNCWKSKQKLIFFLRRPVVSWKKCPRKLWWRPSITLKWFTPRPVLSPPQMPGSVWRSKSRIPKENLSWTVCTVTKEMFFSHVLKVYYKVMLKMYKISLTCKNSKQDNSLSLLTLPVITKCASVQTKQPGQCLEVAWDHRNFASTFLSALVKTKTITR